MKKRTCAVITAILTGALLCACAPQNAAPTVATATQPETAAETTAPEQRDASAKKAFHAALKTIHDDLVWPVLPDSGKIEIFEPATIDDQQFAIADVDGDGEKELIVSVSDTYMAGMCEIVYGYDPANDTVRVEAQAFPGATYYPGMLKVLSSHNQGHAGDVLWPYGVLTYDAASDSYQFTCSVDAWDRNLSETDFEGNPYPEDIDVDNVGHVYLISDGEGDHTLNQADFEEWEAALFAGKEPLDIPWQKRTKENIDAVG